MSNFLRPNKNKLTNAQHYEFMDVFITVMTEAGFTAAKITALLSQLRTAFAEEDRCYMVARASEIIALRDAAELLRRHGNLITPNLAGASAGTGNSGEARQVRPSSSEMSTNARQRPISREAGANQRPSARRRHLFRTGPRPPRTSPAISSLGGVQLSPSSRLSRT